MAAWWWRRTFNPRHRMGSIPSRSSILRTSSPTVEATVSEAAQSQFESGEVQNTLGLVAAWWWRRALNPRHRTGSIPSQSSILRTSSPTGRGSGFKPRLVPVRIRGGAKIFWAEQQNILPAHDLGVFFLCAIYI